MDLIGYNKRVQKDKVTGFEKFAYGCGEISTNIVFTIATSLLTMFYTDVAHVSAATIGMIIAISQIFNGASDICAGFIVDRTRSVSYTHLIAEIAGVHRSTVDKVLHNREGVSQEVRQRVQKIIDEYGYRPNPIGQALKKQDQKIKIGVILLEVDAKERILSGIKEGLSAYQSFDIELM